MNTPHQPLPDEREHNGQATPDPQAWAALLGDLSELHARLQYLKLMLKLGVTRF